MENFLEWKLILSLEINYAPWPRTKQWDFGTSVKGKKLKWILKRQILLMKEIADDLLIIWINLDY